KVHLVGHSRGALPTTRIAVEHPELVENLILFNSRTLAPDAPAAPSTPAAVPTQTNPVPEPPVPTRESIRYSLLSDPYVYHRDHITDEYVEAELQLALLPKLKDAGEQMRRVTSDWVRSHPEEMRENPRLRGRWWYGQLKTDTFDRIRAGGLKAPTLIIWGFNDPSGRPALGVNLYNIIASASERAELHFFNKSGHYVFQEYPREITRLVVDFVRSSKD
ncbi:MAG: alpha/beta hydrolase, partial [Acidobacteriota bacterium]